MKSASSEAIRLYIESTLQRNSEDRSADFLHEVKRIYAELTILQESISSNPSSKEMRELAKLLKQISFFLKKIADRGLVVKLA